MKLFMCGLFLLLVTAVYGGQPVYTDSVFQQQYSIKYVIGQVKDPAGIRLQKVRCDRNGVIQVYSSEGLLRAGGGQFLYPGELAPDVSYQAMLRKHVEDIALYENQFVYADDRTVFSNAWAGKIFFYHHLQDITSFCGGPGFTFLLSDGNRLRFVKDSTVLWEGQCGDKVLDMVYDNRRNAFWILCGHSVQVFSVSGKSLRRKYSAENELTCFALTDKQELIVGTHDGYLVIDPGTGRPIGGIHRRLPNTDLSVIKEIQHRLWFGSAKGAFQLEDNGKFKYYASKRWIPSDKVVDIAEGPTPEGAVLILTDKGLGEIVSEPMTLYSKALFYEKQVRLRHIRLGFNANISRMKEGDVSTGSLEDSDNDGLWTSMYLGAEVFRYAATHSPEALRNCKESLDAMERLYTINSLKGFPSRSFERRGYESADTQVWRHSPNPEWDWKSTTSSDEAIGHMFVFGAIAELIDDTSVKNKAIRLMDGLMSHIVEHDMYMIDWNGEPTTWGKWNPSYVNARPIMVGDRKINSSNIISMLQTAYHFTGKKIYKDKAYELMYRYGYLENLLRPFAQIGTAPDTADELSKHLSGGWNHSDDEMYFLGYWGLYRYAFTDTLRGQFKDAILDHWRMERPEKEGAWDIFTAMTGVKDFDLDAVVWYLQKYPMDLIGWQVKNSDRKDLTRLPENFRDQTITEVLPPDELSVSRHNSNRFELDGGDQGTVEASAGDIWLLPYWMGRYLKVIGGPKDGAGTRRVVSAMGPGAAGGASASVDSAYRDVPYEQDYSIKYYPEDKDATLRKVVTDRNGNIQILSDKGLLEPRGGALLYPGTLVRDVRYRPLLDKKITAIGLYEDQFIYAGDTDLLSNAWAGTLYTPHYLGGAGTIAAGKDFSFLVSDGQNLSFIQHGQQVWKGQSPSPVIDIQYQPGKDLFWILTGNSVASFSPGTAGLRVVYQGDSLTCFAVTEKGILVGSHNGYLELGAEGAGQAGDWRRNLPATDLTVIREINGRMWFGSTEGAFMRLPDGTFKYYNLERWMPGRKVTDIARGEGSTVLVLTDKGLSKICFEPMTLVEKAAYYEHIVRQRHIRYGFYSDYSEIDHGDVTESETRPHDSDNLWTSMYLVGELFRYKVTHDPEARENYRESFDAMERLFTLSGITGLFGRCIERSGNVTFTEEYRKNIERYWYPGYARTPSSWRHSPDPEWDWRGSSSSDQAVGQYFGLTMSAQYAPDADIRQRAIRLIDELSGYILKNDLKLIDADGRPTLWGIWAPEYVNRFPDMVGDKKLYSSNIISFLQIAYHFTGKEKYKAKAEELLHKYGYLQNLTRPVRDIGPAPDTADAWSKELSGGWNSSDDEMYFLAYWGLYPYALSDSLKTAYKAAIKDHWEIIRPEKEGLWDLCYGVITGTKSFDLGSAVWELQKMPLDLINWPVHNSGRADLVYVPANNLERPTRDVLPPDERPENKHNRNLFQLDDNGNGSAELGGGDVYLLPYWMGRYFGEIR